MKINHLVNPLGYDLGYPTISYVTEEAPGKCQRTARVMVALDEGFSKLVYDSGESTQIVSTGFELPVSLEPCTRYYWKVSVTDDTGASALSDVQWFETARVVSGYDTNWQAKWITPDADRDSLAQAYPSYAEQMVQDGKDVVVLAGAGTHEFAYEPSAAYRKTYSLDTPWEDLKKNPKTWEILLREYPYAGQFIPFEKELCTLDELSRSPFSCISQEQRHRIDGLLGEV